MKEDIFSIFVVLIIGIIIGICTGDHFARSSIHKEAISVNVGKWQVSKDGEVSFCWIVNGTNFIETKISASP